jgi:hypothetical protein
LKQETDSPSGTHLASQSTAGKTCWKEDAMSPRSKQRTQEHIVDAQAQSLFKASLPQAWVVRDYRPDYGLDYDVELFEAVRGEQSPTASFETFGEHVFIQLKGCKRAARRSIKLFGRTNVEKTPLREDKSNVVGEMEVVSFPLEVSELVTVQRMGAALPVLLVVAEIETSSLFFVCLNDYIEKILAAQHRDYTSADRRTIHVPTSNLLTRSTLGLAALKWYAMRPKLYAAFQKFIYQLVELQHVEGTEEFLPQARHFATILARYDFWKTTPFWVIVDFYGKALFRFISTGDPGLMTYNDIAIKSIAGEKEASELMIQLKLNEVLTLWEKLSVLPRNYEEICREWMLPTSLGYLLR